MIIKPENISEEMMEKAQTRDLWHFAANLNAMLELGYCSKCFLVPEGCRREGCGATKDQE